MNRGRGDGPAFTFGPVLLLALPVGVCAQAPAQEDAASLVARLCTAEDPAHGDWEILRERGPDALPPVFGALAGRGPAVSGGDVRTALVAAVASWPPATTAGRLLQELGDEPTLQERIVAIELLGAGATRETVDALVEVLAGVEPAFHSHPRVAAGAQAAFQSVLARDPAAWRAVEGAVDGRPPRLLAPLARALGALGSPRGLPLLEGLLEHDAELDREVLEAIGRLAPWGPEADPRRCAGLVGFSLGALDPRVRRQAALALGRLRADEFAPELVRMLEDSDRRVSRGALTALQELTGLSWSADVARWESWLAAEDAWAYERLPLLVEALHGEDSVVAMDAVRELSQHRVFRRDVGAELALVLDHDDAGVAVAACTALVRLDDARSVPHLIECLRDRRARVRTAAGRALAALTGASLPPSEDAWRDWLEG